MHYLSEARSIEQEAETENIAVDGQSGYRSYEGRILLMRAAFSTNKGIHELLLDRSATSTFKMPHCLNGGGRSQTQHVALMWETERCQKDIYALLRGHAIK